VSSTVPARARISSLDGLRGLAAASIVLFHLKQWPHPGQRLFEHSQVLDFAWSSVDLFFALSGFVLMHVHGADFHRLSRAVIVRFAGLRFARVYPLSFAVLLLILALVAADHSFAAWYGRGTDLSAWSFVHTAALSTRWFLHVGNGWNGPVWSLSAEVLGYALFPLLAFVMCRMRLLPTVATALAALLVLEAFRRLRGTVGVNDIGQLSSFLRMGCCMVGGAAACRAVALVPRLPGSGWLAVCAAVAILVFYIHPMPGPGLLPGLYVLLIFALGYRRGVVSSILASPVPVFLGRISFPLYLVHFVPLLWVNFHAPATAGPWGAAVLWTTYLAGCVGVATVLHYVVERPAHRLGRAWQGRDLRPEPEAAAAL
jgi:peptidoglycan/LPS O-acetylase OafA/YrhL